MIARRCHAELATMSSRALQRVRRGGYLTWDAIPPADSTEGGKGNDGPVKETDMVADSACRIGGDPTSADIEKGVCQ
jgi:hypothetical protein